MNRSDPQTIINHSWRDKISQILVRNNLRTDQVAIGELMDLLAEAYIDGFDTAIEVG